MVEVAEVAEQVTNAPTNKLARGTTVGGAVGGVIAGVFAAYGGPMVEELLPEFVGPNTRLFITMLLAGIATWVGTKYGGQAAAFNVMDAPNIPMVRAKPSR